MHTSNWPEEAYFSNVIRLQLPKLYSWFSLFIIICMIALSFFIYYAQFSEKKVVPGQLIADKGVVRIMPPHLGIISKVFVQEGDFVQQNTALIQINSEQPALNAEKLRMYHQKKLALQAELETRKKDRLNLVQLLAKHYITPVNFHASEEKITSLESALNALQFQILQSEQDHAFIVSAPISGYVTNILYHKGQYVNPEQTLLKIIPENTHLEAELFVPLQAANLLQLHQKVLLRYDAYPFARFGVYKATIKSIGQAPVLADEEAMLKPPLSVYYKVIASLDTQFVSYSGNLKPLQQGLTLTGIILGHKFSLWHWFIDPLLHLKDRL